MLPKGAHTPLWLPELSTGVLLYTLNITKYQTIVEVGRAGMVTGRAMQKYKNYFMPSDQIILLVLLCTLNITYQTIVEVGRVGMVTGMAMQKYKNDVSHLTR